MTVGPFGAPDWLRPQPGGSKALYIGTYNSGVGSTGMFLPKMLTAGFQALAIVLIPDQDQYCLINYLDGLTGGVTIFNHPMIVRAGMTASVNKPCVSQVMMLEMHRIDGGASVSGTVYVIGHNAGFDRAVTRGVYTPIAVGSDTIAAFTTKQINLNGPVEGHASLTVIASGAPVFANVNILESDGSVQFLTQARCTAANVPDRADFECPANAIRLDVGNTTGAAVTAQYSLSIGG